MKEDVPSCNIRKQRVDEHYLTLITHLMFDTVAILSIRQNKLRRPDNSEFRVCSNLF